MKNKGFTLLELLLVIGITTTMAIVSFQDKMLETEQAQARRLGMEIFQYNSAVQNYLAHQSGQQNPASVAGTFKGVNWLKSTSCGGAADKAWLSCNFLNHSGGKTTLGRLGFITEIKYDPATGLTGRTVMDKLSLGSGGSTQERADLSGLAALVASGAYAVSDDGKAVNAQDSVVAYCPDIAGVSSNNAVCQGDKGSIVMLSRNLSAADRWLRVDHGNAMQNTLEFRTGDPTPSNQADIQAIDSVSRQIRNVARIYNLGSGNSNGESDNLYLGKKYGNAAKGMVTLPNNAVIIDADQEILGKLEVAASINTRGSIRANGTISADGDISSKKDIVADQNITAKNNLSVGGTATISSDATIAGKTNLKGNLLAEQNALIGGNLQANGQIEGLQNLKIKTNGDFGGKVTAQNINASGNLSSSTLNISGTGRFGGDIYASKIIDSNNEGYYVNPDDLSNINRLNVNNVVSQDILSNGNITAKGYSSGAYILPTAVAVNGQSCHGVANGAMANSPSGETLSCQGGVWKSAVKNSSREVVSRSIVGWRWPGLSVSCPANKTILSGGGACHGHIDGDGRIIITKPEGNGWHIQCDTSLQQNVTAIVYALCE